jgi:CheY-like chemotaxis protein
MLSGNSFLQPFVRSRGDDPSHQEIPSILNFLIVEDETLNRQLLLAIFSHLGHQAFEAANGLEALAFLEQGPAIDAMLLDLHMAHMDGYAVLAQLRDTPRTRDLPVICISAHARPEDQDKALGAGADGYVVKPFRRRELITVIDAVLQRAGTLPPGRSIDRS